LDPEEDRDILDLCIRKQASDEEDAHRFVGIQIFCNPVRVLVQHPFLPDESITQLAYEIFFGATETTSTVIEWFYLSMVAYPDVQERCFQEIQEVTWACIKLLPII
jgi:hypothetical protein